MTTLSRSSPSSPPPRSPSAGSCWTCARCRSRGQGRPRPGPSWTRWLCLDTALSLITSKSPLSPLMTPRVYLLSSSQPCGGPGPGSAAAAPRLPWQQELHPEPGDNRLRLRRPGERAERAECGGGLLPLLGAATHLHAHPGGEQWDSEKTNQEHFRAEVLSLPFLIKWDLRYFVGGSFHRINSFHTSFAKSTVKHLISLVWYATGRRELDKWC